LEDVNHLNLAVLLTVVNLKKSLKFGSESESVLYTIATIALQCPPVFTGWRAGYGLQQYNYCIFEPQHTQINVFRYLILAIYVMMGTFRQFFSQEDAS